MSTTIIYGAGCQGQSLLRLLKNRPEPPAMHCFVDASPSKQGQFLEGYPIHPPHYLQGWKGGELFVLVAVGAHYPEVRRLLEEMGLQEGRDFQDASQKPLSYADLNPFFGELLRKARPHTLLSDDRLGLLFQCVRQVRSVTGDLAEVGVYKGGTAFLIASAPGAAARPLHLFDTFCGLPETDPATDLHRQGDFSDTCEKEVRELLAPFPTCRLYPGVFPETVPSGWQDKRFAFVHIDVDIYQSAFDCCDFFFPRLAPGGILLFDDFGFVSCPGIRRAVNEYFASDPGQIIYFPTGQAMVCKR